MNTTNEKHAEAVSPNLAQSPISHYQTKHNSSSVQMANGHVSHVGLRTIGTHYLAKPKLITSTDTCNDQIIMVTSDNSDIKIGFVRIFPLLQRTPLRQQFFSFLKENIKHIYWVDSVYKTFSYKYTE